ncbi:hypothetical protein D3C80_1545800 [compost metagenome]
MDAAHQVGGGETAHGHGGSGLERYAIRQLDERGGRDQALGGVGAKGIDEAGVGDAIPDGDVGHPLAQRFHDTGRLDAEAVWHGDGVGAVAKIGVGIVQTDRRVAQAHLAWPGLANTDLFITQDLGPPGFIKANGVGHGCSPDSFMGENIVQSESRGLRKRPLCIGRQPLFIS